MFKRLLLLTGGPGAGKTTVLMKAVQDLKANGHSVGGMISQDVRSSGSRIGFEILDVSSGRRGWLASVYQKQGPQVGRYRVNLDDLNSIGAEAILSAVDNFDVVVVDEIGPMELFSEDFRRAVDMAVESKKLAMCTVHWKMSNTLVECIKKRADAEMFTVTHENRERVHGTIVRKALDFLLKTEPK